MPQARPRACDFFDGPRQPFEGRLELCRSLLPSRRLALLQALLVGSLCTFIHLPLHVPDARISVRYLHSSWSGVANGLTS